MCKQIAADDVEEAKAARAVARALMRRISTAAHMIDVSLIEHSQPGPLVDAMLDIRNVLRDPGPRQ
ncbi:MAG TPA: hypothetical protein VK453_24440 [Micromonosporaceae bacterium]|nr:hypothetical protein [Micromonosporaceae bacterium]